MSVVFFHLYFVPAASLEKDPATDAYLDHKLRSMLNQSIYLYDLYGTAKIVTVLSAALCCAGSSATDPAGTPFILKMVIAFFVPQRILKRSLRGRILPIQVKHLFQLQELQHRHGDPFARLLIAQAISENLTVLSADKQFQAWPVRVIW